MSQRPSAAEEAERRGPGTPGSQLAANRAAERLQRTERRDDRADQQTPGLVQGSVLEGGDGADAGGAAVLREDHLRQRDSGECRVHCCSCSGEVSRVDG